VIFGSFDPLADDALSDPTLTEPILALFWFFSCDVNALERPIAARAGWERAMSLIAAELARQGHLKRSGNPYSASSVRGMLDGPMPSA
jgi:hypothetical protein